MSTNCKSKCSRCGNCCMPFVPITLDEYYTIKDYISKNNINYVAPQPYINEDGEQEIDLRCCFYDKVNKKCNIYDVRPEACKSYTCMLSSSIEEHNRAYYDKKADINGNHLDRFIPFDLLFYGSPITAILLSHYFLHDKTKYNEKLLLSFLLHSGEDRKFFNKYKLNSTWDIVDGIKKKEIILDWSE